MAETAKSLIEVEPGANLRKAARDHGIAIYGGLDKYLNCRGMGLCGTCKVHVKEGMENLSPPSLMERINMSMHPMTIMAKIGHEEELRLACQVKVNGDCTIETRPRFNWFGETDKKGKHFWETPYPNK